MGWTDWLWIFKLARALVEALLSIDPKHAADKGLIRPGKESDHPKERF